MQVLDFASWPDLPVALSAAWAPPLGELPAGGVAAGDGVTVAGGDTELLVRDRSLGEDQAEHRGGGGRQHADQ